MLKRVLYMLPACLLGVLLTSSCESRSEKGPGYPVVFEVTLPDNFNSKWDGDAFPITIKSNVDWGVKYDEGSDWFEVMPDFWEKYGEDPVTKKADLVTETNDFSTVRKGGCTIVPTHGRQVRIEVVQEGMPEGMDR